MSAADEARGNCDDRFEHHGAFSFAYIGLKFGLEKALVERSGRCNKAICMMLESNGNDDV
jgi:hypothetical protein